MSLFLKYKRYGIKAMKNSNFDLASRFFSLAYLEKDSKEILFLLNLCFAAKINKSDSIKLFEFYNLFYKKNSKLDEFYEILDSIIISSKKEDIKSDNAIMTYDDFKFLVKKSNDFKSIFERVVFSTKVLISSKTDLINFINDLIDNGFIELSFNYLEAAISIYNGDEELLKIADKIKHYENTNRK